MNCKSQYWIRKFFKSKWKFGKKLTDKIRGNELSRSVSMDISKLLRESFFSKFLLLWGNFLKYWKLKTKKSKKSSPKLLKENIEICKTSLKKIQNTTLRKSIVMNTTTDLWTKIWGTRITLHSIQISSLQIIKKNMPKISRGFQKSCGIFCVRINLLHLMSLWTINGKQKEINKKLSNNSRNYWL